MESLFSLVSSSIKSDLSKDECMFDKSGMGVLHEAGEQVGKLVFKVMKLNKYGLKQNRLLQVNKEEGTFRLMSAQMQFKKVIRINSISQIEKSTVENERCIFIFMGDVVRPYDLIFVDNEARERLCAMFCGISPSILCKESVIQRMPNWVSDEEALECMLCEAEFGILRRRHHCRQCGAVICGNCSEKTAVLPHLGYQDPVRVCDPCFESICDHRVIQHMRNGTSECISPSNRISSPSLKPVMRGLPATVRRKTELLADDFILVDESRDAYGFLLKSEENADSRINFESSDNDDAQSAIEKEYRNSIEKQRHLWNNFLANHARISRTDEDLKPLVRDGIPPELRGYIWQILSGSKDKQASEKPTYYKHLLVMAQVNPTQSVNEIEKDLHRTFPNNSTFETEEGIATLRRVLVAYSVRNPTVGYCQSMNFLCAMLLLFMEEEEAFWLLSVVVEGITKIPKEDNFECGDDLHGIFYYQRDLAGAMIDQSVFKDLVAEYLPKVHAHLETHFLPLEPLTINWFLCLFINSLPLEATLRIWDILFHDGPKILFRAGLTILKLNEKAILKANSVEGLMTVFKNTSLCANDVNAYMKACFDRLFFGSFKMSRVNEIRQKYRTEYQAKLSLYSPISQPITNYHSPSVSPPVPSQYDSNSSRFESTKEKEYNSILLQNHQDESKDDVKLVSKFDEVFKSPNLTSPPPKHFPKSQLKHDVQGDTSSKMSHIATQNTPHVTRTAQIGVTSTEWPLSTPQTNVNIKKLVEKFSANSNQSQSIDPKFHARADAFSFYLGHMRPSPLEDYCNRRTAFSLGATPTFSNDISNRTPNRNLIGSFSGPRNDKTKVAPTPSPLKNSPITTKEQHSSEEEEEATGNFVKIEFTDFKNTNAPQTKGAVRNSSFIKNDDRIGASFIKSGNLQSIDERSVATLVTPAKKDSVLFSSVSKPNVASSFQNAQIVFSSHTTTTPPNPANMTPFQITTANKSSPFNSSPEIVAPNPEINVEKRSFGNDATTENRISKAVSTFTLSPAPVDTVSSIKPNKSILASKPVSDTSWKKMSKNENKAKPSVRGLIASIEKSKK